MIKRLLFLSLILTCLSCQRKGKILIHQDFENLIGWYDSPTLVKGSAHSGSFFTRTGPGAEYSQTFRSSLSNISDRQIRRIDMGAWIRVADTSAKARLVLSIESADSIVYWQSLNSWEASPKPGEWTRIFFTYDLPDQIKMEDIVKVYLWNESTGIVDADDIDIIFFPKD